MKSKSLLSMALVSGGLLLTACGGGGGDDPPSPVTPTGTSSTTATYNVALSGTQTVPEGQVNAAPSPASGTATLTFDSATNSFTGTVSISGLANITAVKIHRGLAGSNAADSITLSANSAGTGYVVNSTLSGDDLAALPLGLLYIEVRSGAGRNTQAIRGQILPTGIKIYRAILAAVGGVTTTASGVAAVTVNEASGVFGAFMTLKNLSNTFVGAHIHPAAGTPTVATFKSISTGLTTLYDAHGTFNSTQLQALKNGEYYVNFHTTAYPDGEIKGTLIAD